MCRRHLSMRIFLTKEIPMREEGGGGIINIVMPNKKIKIKELQPCFKNNESIQESKNAFFF